MGVFDDPILTVTVIVVVGHREYMTAAKVTKGIIEVLATMKNSRCVESSQAESENTQNDGGIAGCFARCFFLLSQKNLSA